MISALILHFNRKTGRDCTAAVLAGLVFAGATLFGLAVLAAIGALAFGLVRLTGAI